MYPSKSVKILESYISTWSHNHRNTLGSVVLFCFFSKVYNLPMVSSGIGSRTYRVTEICDAKVAGLAFCPHGLTYVDSVNLRWYTVDPWATLIWTLYRSTYMQILSINIQCLCWEKKSVDKWTLEWKPTLFRGSTVKPFLTLKDKEVNFGLINNS